MAKRKRPRARREQRPTMAQFLRRHRRSVRWAGALVGLAGVAVALFFIADPFGGTPTAIDATGQEVTAGVIESMDGAAPRAGRPAPNFLLPDYERRAVRLDQFRDKVVFVNFWASWCTFCEAEMADILRAARAFPDEVVVIAINRGEPESTAKAWTAGHSFPVDLPNVYWVLDEREAVTRAYRVEGMPQSFVIDRRGFINREIRRVTEYDEIRASIEQALAVGNPVLPDDLDY
jgi:peroxiredoxin